MKEKLLRGITIFSSVVLLAASVAIIFWINQSEEARLALRERFTIEKIAQLGSGGSATPSQEQSINSKDNVEQVFSQIDTLLSSLSSDDLPEEE